MQSISPELLKSYGRHKLLNRDQEIELGRQIQVMIVDSDPNSATYRQGQRAKEKLINSNMRLVIKIASKYQNRGIDIEVLIQQGSIGLQRAAEKFDPSKGFRFSTYAYNWIRQAITRHIAENSAIKVPAYLVNIKGRATEAHHKLRSKLGRNPTISEISEILGEKETTVQRALRLPECSVSLDAPLPDETHTVADLIPSQLPHGGIILDSIEVRHAIERLSWAHRDVIICKYFRELSLTKIAQRMSISLSSATQLEKEALERLREALK